MDAELIAGEYRLPLPDLWLEAAGFDNRDALLPLSLIHILCPGYD